MRYDAYERKIKKVASVLKTIRRHMAKIIIAIAVTMAIAAMLIASVTALLAAKGSIISAECPDEVIYGTAPECKAVAFLSKVGYEYCASDGSWTEGLPQMVGEYKVRATAKTVFGGTRHSKEMELSVLPKNIDVTFAAESVEYGALPGLSGDLSYDDKIICESFDFGDYLLSDETGEITSEITPVKEDLRIVASDGTDVTSAYIINVSQKNMMVTPKKLGVTVSDKSAVYNGMKFSYDGYEISGGELANGDTLQALFNAYLVDAGSIDNTPELTVISKNGKIVTHCYKMDVKVGKLTVEQRPIVITTADGSFDYDAKWHSNDGYTLSSDTPLVEGHLLSAVSRTEIRDAGVKDNVIGFKINEGDEDKTANYSVFLMSGKLTVKPKAVTVTTESDEFTYDGNEHVYEKVQVSGLLNDHICDKEAFWVCNAGVYENKINVKISDADGEFVTSNYDITYKYGTIVVNKRSVTVVPAGNTWVYDGKEHFCHDFTYGSKGAKLVDWHRLEVTEGSGITDVGSVVNRFEKYVVYNTKPLGTASKEEDVTSNYDLTVLDGATLKITKRPITLAPVHVEAVYDDTEHSAVAIGVAEGSLANGHTLGDDFTLSGSRIYPGKSTSRITALPSVFDAKKNDVTDNYDIKTQTDSVVVNPRPVTVIVDDEEKIYDGTDLTPKSAKIWDKSTYKLVDGHVLESVTLKGSQLDAGSSSSYAQNAVIKNAKGENVTKYYEVSYHEGKLTVKPRPISIKPVDVEVVYDAKAHMATAWEYQKSSRMQLVDGEEIKAIE